MPEQNGGLPKRCRRVSLYAAPLAPCALPGGRLHPEPSSRPEKATVKRDADGLGGRPAPAAIGANSRSAPWLCGCLDSPGPGLRPAGTVVLAALAKSFDDGPPPDVGALFTAPSCRHPVKRSTPITIRIKAQS